MSENSSRTDTAIRRRALELWRAWFQDVSRAAIKRNKPMPSMDVMQQQMSECYDMAIAEYQAEARESEEADELEHRRSL